MKVTTSIAAVAMALAAVGAHAQRSQNTLTWGFATEIETFDPYATGKTTLQLLARNVLENLLMRDATGKPRPALATSWRQIDDTTMEFELRRGVTFHNGQPFDADDVVYSVDFVKKPDSKISSQSDYGFLARAEKLGPYKVRLIFSAPTPSAIDRLTQMLFILPRVAHATMTPAQFASKPIGTGPYVVSDFKAGRGVELTRNSGYYQADWGVPRFDRIKILSIPDPQTLTSELSSGRVDFVWGVSPDNMALLKGNKGITTVTGGSNTFSFLSLDSSGRTGPNPLQDKNVRLAIAHAINRPAISQVLRGPGSSVINAPCHPLQFGCVSSLGTPTYDLKKAKAFMKASAYPNGFDLTVSSFTEGGPVAEAIVGDLSAIGIKGKVDQRETSAWVKDFFGGKLRAAVVPWPSAGVRDAAAAVNVFFTGGQGDYTRDQEVMDAFKSAGTLAKPAQRELLYRKGFEKISREMPVVPLMTNVANYAYRTGLDMTPPADGYPLAYLMGWKK